MGRGGRCGGRPAGALQAPWQPPSWLKVGRSVVTQRHTPPTTQFHDAALGLHSQTWTQLQAQLQSGLRPSSGLCRPSLVLCTQQPGPPASMRSPPTPVAAAVAGVATAAHGRQAWRGAVVTCSGGGCGGVAPVPLDASTRAGWRRGQVADGAAGLAGASHNGAARNRGFLPRAGEAVSSFMQLFSRKRAPADGNAKCWDGSVS